MGAKNLWAKHSTKYAQYPPPLPDNQEYRNDIRNHLKVSLLAQK
jgi:hypothetical protein